MTNFKSIRVVLMMAAVVSLLAAQTEPPQQTVLPIGSAVVTQVKGQVVLTSPQGTPVVAQPGSNLPPESRIETAKGSVLLELRDGSQVLVKAHSTVLLKAPNQGIGSSLELFLGQILFKVQKRLGSAPSFRMGTPSAVITVRGTRFLVEVNKKGATLVEVFEGLVEVAGITEGSPHILVNPGFYTGVERGRAPERPREMNPGEGRDDGRQGQGPGADRSPDDQRNQTRQDSHDKPD